MAIGSIRMEAMTMGERRRILTLYQKDWPTGRIAEAIGRSVSGVRRVRQRYRERGRLEPLKRGNGRPPKVSAADRRRLAALVAQQPDATLDELRQRSGLSVSRSTIDRHLRTLRLSFKKK
jgi:transposase